jgi:hypothetical protein
MFDEIYKLPSNVIHMKQPEYREGPKATEDFEEGMKALFSVPKAEIVKAEKGKKGKTSSCAQSVRKPHLSDKD